MSAALSEGMITQRYTVQAIMNGIYATGVWSSFVFALCLTIICIVVTFLMFVPENFKFIYNRSLINSSDSITFMLYTPLATVLNQSIEIIKDCYPVFASEMDFTPHI